MNKEIAKNIFILIAALTVSFVICSIVQNLFETTAAVTAVFVLGVFFISLLTDGYKYGVAAALISILAVNFAFTFPYQELNFVIPANIVSAIILIVVLLVICGITFKLKREHASRAEAKKTLMKSSFLRKVAHDLRSPLTAIYASSMIMLDRYNDLPEEKNKRLLKGINEESENLMRMVENLLSIIKLEYADIKIAKKDIVIDELIDNVIAKFKKSHPNQDIILNIPDNFITVSIDAPLIEQVVINILENAVQHAKGMTELSLKVFEENGKVVFEIKDNGCGISQDKINDIFTGFYTANESLSDGKSNAGIGLSVCEAIIRAHGGDIGVENLESGGTAFRFKLDMEETANE